MLFKNWPAQFSAIDSKYYDKRCKEIRNSISALESLAEYKLALDELRCTESLEDTDRRLFEQKSVLADIACKAYGTNGW